MTVHYETDTENGYFERAQEPGKFTLQCRGRDVENFSLNLWDGIASLTIALPSNVDVGDTLCFETEVEDNKHPIPFTHTFWVHVGKGGGKRPPPKPKTSTLAMPKIRRVRKEEWTSFKFNEYSALDMTSALDGKGYEFYINVDNAYLRRHVEKDKTNITPETWEKRYAYGLVILAMAILNHRKNHPKKEQEEDNEISDNEHIASVAQEASAALLPMIQALGALVVERKEEDGRDDGSDDGES